jgi:hypothetical protein
MKIDVLWDNEEHTILRRVYHAPYTLKEYHQAIDRGNDMIASVAHKVDILVELRNYSPTHPPGTLSKMLKYADKYRLPNEGVMIFVMPKEFHRQVNFAIITRISNKPASQYFHVETLEEAYALIHGIRQQSSLASTQ